MKVVDCFTFYNEMDLLKYRLNVLKGVADYVVIVESTHTHVGNEKPLYFDELKKSMPILNNNRIIHIIVDDFPHKAPNIQCNSNYDGEQWVNERFQRDCISRGLEQITDLENDDIIIVSDLDEIPDPRTIQKIKNGSINVTINKLEMAIYYYNLNTKAINNWTSAYIGKYREISSNINGIAYIRINPTNTPNIANGGWHLSYFGDVPFIQNKLKQFGHIEYSGDEYTDENFIKNKIDKSISLFNRNDGDIMIKISIKENRYPPLYYKIFLSKYVSY